MHAYKHIKSLNMFPMQLFLLVTCCSHMDIKELEEMLNIIFQNRCRIWCWLLLDIDCLKTSDEQSIKKTNADLLFPLPLFFLLGLRNES